MKFPCLLVRIKEGNELGDLEELIGRKTLGNRKLVEVQTWETMVTKAK